MADPPTTSLAWECRVGAIARIEQPPPTQGFMSDHELKRKIRQAMGPRPVPCPKDVGRTRLLEVACQLNLVSSEDAARSALRRGGRPLSWSKRVELAAPSSQPSIEGSGFVTDSTLKSALEAYIGGGVRAPEKLGRSTLLEQALKLNLLETARAELPAQLRLEMGDLKKLWAEHARGFGKGQKPQIPSTRKQIVAALLDAGKLSEAEAEAKCVREDRAAAMQEARMSTQACRTTSVASLFKGVPNADAVKAALVCLSEDASRLFYQRSFLVWLHLARLVEEGLPLPDMKGDQLDRFVRQAYTFQTEGSQLKDPAWKATFDLHSRLFPILPRPKQDNVTTHAANAYAGAMRRHFANTDIVKRRIKRYASAKLFGVVRAPPPPGEEDDDENEPTLLQPEVGDSPLYNIVGALECKDFDESAMHPRQVEVLEDVRTTLGLPRGTELDSNWLRANIHASIRFSLRTVKVLDDLREQADKVQKDLEHRYPDEKARPKLKKGCARGLHFVPLNALKRRFVTVDATDMAALLGLPSSGPFIAQAVREMLIPNVKKIFGEKMAHHPDDATRSGEAWYLTGTFDTDGFSIHPHFQRRKTADEAARSASKTAEAPKKSLPPPPKAESAPKLLLLVDPGRVNLVTITVMKDGEMVKRTHKGRTRPLKFTFTTKQYYALMGETRRKIIRERRARKDVDGAVLRRQQSAASLRTGNYRDVVAYVQASLDQAAASGQAWARALKRGAATERWRRQAAKDGVLLRWFHSVRKSVGKLTGLYDATVVWGCKVQATGKGNLSAPTERSALVASRVAGWKVVRGDEYNTSKLAFVTPHAPNLSPRFRGVKSVVRHRLGKDETVSNRVRDGWVEGLTAKRILCRIEHKNKPAKQIGKKCVKQPKERTKWEYEGTSADSASVKAARKEERQANGMACRYVRGLRVFIQDQVTTKFVDRDVNGSVNIGLLWISDNIQGRSRPQVFVRPQKDKKAAKFTKSLPAQNSG